jgi:hypothetical protein
MRCTRSSAEAALTAEQMPMDLMVKKPPVMTWRNRSTTMNALDLIGFDDDPILNDLFDGGTNGPSSRYVLLPSFLCVCHVLCPL